MSFCAATFCARRRYWEGRRLGAEVAGGTTVEERGAGFTASARAAVGGNDGVRVVRRRRPLPSTRAVVGGFLVAVAAVGTFAVATRSQDDRLVPYVVARGDLAVGERVDADDLTVARADVPPFLSERAFRAAGEVVGSVVVAPVARGELVQRSAVLRETPPGRQVSFPVEGARAVDGTLQPGQRTLADGWGRQPSPSEVDPYWRELIQRNRTRLVDPANADLLLPGQVLVLPPVPLRPAA